MAKSGNLKDNETGEIIYPNTLANNVYDANGNAITGRLPNIGTKEFMEQEYAKTLNLLSSSKFYYNQTLYTSQSKLQLGSRDNNDRSSYYLIPLDKNTEYTLKTFDDTYIGTIYLSDENGENAASQKEQWDTNLTYTFNSGDYNAISFAIKKIQNGTEIAPQIDNVKISLIKGTNAPTEYQPYNGAIVHQKDLDGVLLWENGNKTSSQSSAFTGTLAENVRNYNYIVCVIKHWSEGRTSPITWAKVEKDVEKAYSPLMALHGSIGYSYRDMSITGNSVSFGAIKSSNSSTDLLIPIYIYGIK